MSEKGCLSVLTESVLAEKADELLPLKGVWEMIDGPAFLFVFRNVDDTLGEKVKEDVRILIRTALDKIFLEKDYATACDMAATFVDGLVDIPGLDDATEQGVFKGIFSAIAALLAQAGTEKEEEIPA